MSRTIEVMLALTPFIILIAGFLVFQLDALSTSIWAWLAELVIFLVYYRHSPLQSLEASIWGNVTMWTGFLVLYSGQLFGQAYKSTGLLDALLDSVESVLPTRDKEGRAIALVTVVGGFIGAFNGFATYPVTIPGLVALGFDGVQAAAAYLVYFSWSIPFVSLFIAANISSRATHLPVPQIAQISGILSIPLVFLSLMGFFKILKFSFFERETQTLFWLLGLGNVVAIILFTQVWPAYYILTLVAGAAISFVTLYGYGRFAGHNMRTSKFAASLSADVATVKRPSRSNIIKAYIPLMVGVVIVAMTSVPRVAQFLSALSFSVSAWGYTSINVNIITSAGFFICLTTLCCYLFRAKHADIGADIIVATKRSASSLATLFVGSAMVYLMVDSGQIALLGHTLSKTGTTIYSATFPLLAFLGGMAFGQGLPGDFMFSQMQIPVAPLLGIPLVVLVGIVTVVTMGPANPLKPAVIKYVASLAGVTGQDGHIFRKVLGWQLLQIAVTAVVSVILVVYWR